MSREEPKYNGYIKPVSLSGMASRIFNRNDSHMDYKKILAILNMFFEEAEKALENGEKIKLGEIGNLTPQVHTPRAYDEEPYTEVVFRRRIEHQKKMDKIFRKNIEEGFAGLGIKCMCNAFQIGLLKRHGYLTNNEEDEKYLDEK